MKFRQVGEKAKIACETCQALRPATWNFGTYHLQDGRAVDKVMMVTCDVCGKSGGIATQSAWRIEEAQREAVKRTSVMVTLSLQDLAAHHVKKVGAEPFRGPELLTRLVLKSLMDDPTRLKSFVKRLRELESPLLREPASVRMNLSLSPELQGLLRKVSKNARLNQSEVVRRALVFADSDDRVAQLMQVALKP